MVAKSFSVEPGNDPSSDAHPKARDVSAASVDSMPAAMASEKTSDTPLSVLSVHAVLLNLTANPTPVVSALDDL